MTNLTDNRRVGVGGRTIIDAVNIAEDDENLRIHHGCDEPRQFIVVREHQFADRNRIVFIDDRDDVIFEHHRHTVLLVQIVAACPEILFGRKHLPDGNAMLAEELVIAVDQFCLAYGRKQLALVYTVELLLRMYRLTR